MAGGDSRTSVFCGLMIFLFLLSEGTSGCFFSSFWSSGIVYVLGVSSSDPCFINDNWRLIGDLIFSSIGEAKVSMSLTGDVVFTVRPGDLGDGDSFSFGGGLVFSGLPGFRETFRGIGDGLSSSSAADYFVYLGGWPPLGAAGPLPAAFSKVAARIF